MEIADRVFDLRNRVKWLSESFQKYSLKVFGFEYLLKKMLNIVYSVIKIKN